MILNTTKKIITAFVAFIIIVALALPWSRRQIERFINSFGIGVYTSIENGQNILSSENDSGVEVLEHAEVTDLNQLLVENAKLRELLKLTKQSRKLLPAEIISRNPWSWNRRFQINRGLNHGIVLGQVVLADGYVIGRIYKVYNNSAEVMTIADKSCKISIRFEGSTTYGILQGRESGDYFAKPECQVDYIPRYDEVKKGMIAVTSGYGTHIPGGLPIGNIVTKNLAAPAAEVIDNSYLRCQIYPFADFKSLHFVAVVLNK